MHPVYQGVPRQRGNGLGSIFKAAAKTVIPFLKPIVKSGLTNLKKQTIAGAHEMQNIWNILHIH